MGCGHISNCPIFLPSPHIVLFYNDFLNKFFRSFDARRECNIRKYSYLLPAEIIGIKDTLSAAEIDCHLTEFSNILSSFEVRFNCKILYCLRFKLDVHFQKITQKSGCSQINCNI